MNEQELLRLYLDLGAELHDLIVGGNTKFRGGMTQKDQVRGVLSQIEGELGKK